MNPLRLSSPSTTAQPAAVLPFPTFIKERRRGISDLEIASLTLAHAVSYLVSEQFAGRRNPLQANRAAIALLCEAGSELAAQERREPAYQAITAWLPKLPPSKGVHEPQQ